MAIIFTYPIVDPTATDLVLLTDASNKNYTKQSTVEKISSLATTVVVPQEDVAATFDGAKFDGVGDGSALSRDKVYDIKFNVTNPGQPTNLSIDGSASYKIEKGTELGWANIDASSLVPGTNYYLVWDGDRFQLNESNPASTSTVEFVNPDPVTEAHGGISKGQTFARKSDGNGYTIQEMFDMILYPYQVPTLSGLSISGQGPTVEVGYTIPSGAQTFNWSKSNPGNIKPNSGVITDLTASTSLATGVAIESTSSLSVNLPVSIQKTTGSDTHRWQISGENTQGGSISPSSYTVTWLWRKYVGNNASTTLAEADIEALSVSSGLASSLNGTYTFPGGGYKYLCVPSSFPQPSSITSGGFPVAMASTAEGYAQAGTVYNFQLVSVTNSYGQTIDYRVYRSLNILNGSAKFIVS